MKSMRPVVAALFVVLTGLFATGCEDALLATLLASDYGVNDPDSGALVLKNETTDRDIASAYVENSFTGAGMSLSDVAHGSQKTCEIEPGTYQLWFWTTDAAGQDEVQYGWGPWEFSVGNGEAAAFSHYGTGDERSPYRTTRTQ